MPRSPVSPAYRSRDQTITAVSDAHLYNPPAHVGPNRPEEGIFHMSKTKVTPEQFKAELELQDRFATIFRTNGWDPVADKNVDINDALDIQNAAFMIPKAMTTIVQEGIEPMLIGTHLLQKIQYKPGMMTVFPAVEPLRAEETGDGMDLPIYNINIGGAQSFGVTVKRHGLRLKIAKRFVEESAYPWINFWLRLAGNALARHKEEYIFDFITKLGTLVFDNDPNSRLSSSTLQPIKGVTTGRNYKGVLNGSMTVDDVFDMYAAVLLNGFVPDTLLVHPMAWLMWVKDPVLREFAIQAGGGSFFANFTGNPAVLGNKFYNNGGLGIGQGQTGQYTNGHLTGGEVSQATSGNYQNMTSAPILPNYLGIPFRILVSPFVNFDPEQRTTDIMMFNSRNLGALIVAEEPHVKSWEDGQYNIQNMSIEETYGFGILNEGQAIAVARNVKIRPNEFVMPARTVYNLSDSDSTYTDLGTAPIFDPANPLNVNA